MILYYIMIFCKCIAYYIFVLFIENIKEYNKIITWIDFDIDNIL